MLSTPESPPTAAPAYDCQKCGACCVSWDCVPDYVYLEPKDKDRMSKATYADFTRGYGRQRHRVMQLAFIPAAVPDGVVGEVFACKALRGIVGDEVACGIYEERPKACRRFEVGSEDCLEMRRRAGLSAPPTTT